MTISPKPVNVCLHQISRILELEFDDSSIAKLEAEYLRVYSPSAQVQGHGPGQAVLQVGKEQVSIADIEAVGNYAIRLVFDDGHNTGIFTWQYLYELHQNQTQNWQKYLSRLEQAGYSRKAS